MLALTPEQTAAVKAHLREVGTATDKLITANGRHYGWWAYHRAKVFCDETPTDVLMVAAAYCDDELAAYCSVFSHINPSQGYQVLADDLERDHIAITQAIAARRRKEAHVG